MVERREILGDLKYTKEHEWVRLEGDRCRVGITDYAQNSLHEVVYADLPKVGRVLGKGESFGTVESVKAVSECYMPVSGEIAAVNGPLADNPVLLNQSPYGDGWMVLVKPDDSAAVSQLLTAEAYLTRLKGGV